MSVYKDGKTGKWRVIYRFTDYTGERKQTQKRGFETRREAVAWEHEQILKAQSSLKQIEAMPMPTKTLKGDFKVSPDQYRNLVATAKRMDIVLDREKAISRKETKLREERSRLEAERKLPIGYAKKKGQQNYSLSLFVIS